MKQKLSHLFAVFVALVIATPIANAAYPSLNFHIPSTDNSSLYWKTDYNASEIHNNLVNIRDGGYYRQAAASDGMLFSLPSGTENYMGPAGNTYVTYGHIIGKSVQTYWSGGTNTSNATYYPYKTSGSYYYLGPAIASDEKGTLWCTSVRSGDGPGASPWAIGAKAFTYYTTRPQKKDGEYGATEGTRNAVNIIGTNENFATSGRADLMSVSGNGVDDKAFFWFAVGGSNKIECIVMDKGVIKRKNTFYAPDGVTFPNDYAGGYVKEFAEYTRLLLNVGSSGDNTTELYLGSISGGKDGLYNGTAKVTWDNPGATGLKVARYGSTAFLLQGHGILVYSSSPTEIKLYDWTARKEIGTIKPFGDNVSKSTYVSHSMDVKVAGDKHSADLYIYSPGVGGAKYTITLSQMTDPASNIRPTYVNDSSREIVISWDNAEGAFVEKYRIRYSTDGGTTWSEAIETPHVENEKGDPTYTFKNLPQGTYLFDVTPFYNYDFRGQSGEWTYDAWGESATSEIKVDYTHPVENLSVETGTYMPYSAVVNWDLPIEGTPTKYAVSYSADGGSTWSTPVEITANSQTFSDIAAGQYLFKVRPFYEVSWGDEITSNTIVYGVNSTATNIATRYNNNLGNRITVSWTAPEVEKAPDKYLVCYTSNDGSTWSEAVETTDPTYTFNDLAIGTYKFKVTPIYGSFPCEDAISESVEVVEANGYTFTTEKLWESKGEIAQTDASDSREIAVSNNKLYVIASKHDSKIYYIGDDKKWNNFESGYAQNNFGYPMDNDDVGNIIIKSGNYFGSPAIKFTIYPAGATSNTNKTEIALSGDYLPGERADFIGAQGNLLSSGGGYVWIIPKDQKKLMRISIVNGKLYGVATWTFSDSFHKTFLNGVTQPVVRPLPDGRLYVHTRGNGYKIITLPANDVEITADMVETITSTGSSPSSNMNSDIFILQGHTFHVRNDGAKTQSIGVAIKNLTEEGNGDITYTPFEGKDVNGKENGLSGISGYGSLVRAVKVNDYNYDIYSYSPNHGVTVYRVSAKATHIKTDKLADLSYERIEGENQDIKLTWVAPKNATPSSYKIYRDGEILATVDASTLTYTDEDIIQNHIYTVVPIFAGANENAEDGLSVTTEKTEITLYAPEITEVRNYDGYSIVEIFYKMPAESKTKPAYYNIYRNGVLLETGLTQYNFIDDQLPKIDKAVDYTYIVEAVYKPEYDNATRTSKEETVTVKARDWSLSGYQLQEVYNIPISPVIGNLPNNFTNEEYYRQGHFYNGNWYIAQLSDQLSRKDQGISGGAINKSEIEGATGGVVAIKATEEADIRMGFSNKVLSSDEFASAGLAIDDKGVIFMRHNNNSKLEATAPTGSNWVSWLYDAFDRRITEGALYVPSANGNYSSEPSAIIDLSALWLDNRWIDKMYFTGTAGNGQVKGRSDYYYMYGDVMSSEGGYLLLSPSWTRTIFKVKIANGKYVNHETHELNQYQSKEGMVDVTVGTGNYGFRIDGRNAWIAQLRSSGYFGIHGEEDHAEEGEEAHEHEMHAIFVTDSRINNTGGTSIVAFNSAEGANDGETFLITPTNMHSRNYGDFIVTRGTKTNTTDPASEAKFMPPMPVAQIKQTNISENLATNASGNWFHAEVGTYESATGEQSECVYIYQYVPGIRFAKYRMVSDLTLPVVSPTLEITTAYNDENTEITHFNGKSTWQRPASFGITDLENASVWIKSYTFELVDDKGNVVYTDEVPEAKDAEGNPVYEFDYVTDKNIENVDNCDLDFKTYTARIAVNYEFKNGDIQQSSFNYAIASNDYDAEKASDLAVHVFKKEKVTEYVWVENPNTTETTEDDWVAVPKEFDTYRVELDFNPPAWSADANPEPISYYTVKALVNNQTDLIEITDFHLHTGAEVVNGVEKATYEVASQIPGTYNFSQYNKGGNKAPYYHTVGKDYGVGGESRRAGVLTWHHKVDYGQYSGGVATTAEGDEIVITDEPNKWVFIVEAHYGAKNRYIAKSAEASIGVEDQKYIETGVEVVGDNTAALKIYPIPATTSITVKASEAINSIVIYNEAGVEVINEMGNGENITMVNIENLSTGFYFVKVNNYEPVKIIKK